MTQEQYKWLQDNGYDPTVHDVDDQGNIFENPINAPAPQKEVMSVPRAFGTSFLGNVLPAGAGLGAGSLLAPLALSNPWTGIPAVIAGNMAAAYGTGKGQQALLENYAPEAVAEMQRAETDQPVASWAGGSAPALLTFKPSFKGISGLSAPLMRGRDTFTKFDPATIARFTPAAVDVGVNAASAGAGQLVNMSEGGEFSLPRFAADTAFGSIVSNPNAIGRKMGFPSLTPQRGPVTRLELTPEPTLGSPIEESQKLYGSMPEGSVGRPPSLSQVANADKTGYEAYSGYKEPEPSKSAETLARELYSAELDSPSGKPPSLGTVASADKTAYEAYSGQQPAPAPEVVKNATDAAREVYTRLQGSAEEGPARITQEDLDAASEIAAVRGLKLQFEDLGGGRGKFQLQTPDGIPIISIDPSAATRDTAIHEIGHDVFARSVGEGMQKGLLGSVEESPTYKAEYEARINARDKEGKPTHTEQQARDIALEEGLIQKFGEEYPNVKPGEIRQWFNALKASIKDLAGMKLSPEDANAYLRYLTNENVPWKGVAVAKGGEERMQGPEDNLSGQANTVRLIKTLVNQQGDLGKIEMRELVQNALDAVYKKPSKSDGAYEPREVSAEVHDRSTALVSDTGTGMSPNFLSKGYLQLSVSTKGLNEGGGFGLAKAALFGRSEEFEVRTVWTDPENGRRFYSRLEGIPKGFYNAQTSDKPAIDLASITTQPKAFKLADGLTMHVAEIVSAKQETPDSQYVYDGPDGTAVAIKYPEETRLDTYSSDRSLNFNSDQIQRNYFYRSGPRDIKNPFREKIEGSLFTKTEHFPNIDENLYKIESSENAKPVLEEVDLPNAKVKTYLEPRNYDSHYISYEVYSNGVFQYGDSVSADVSSKYPRLLFDVKSKVLGEDPNYPFTLNRNAVQGAVSYYIKSTTKGFADKQAQQQKEIFANALIEAPKITTARGDSVSILDVSKSLPSEIIRTEMTNDPIFGDIIEFSSLLHNIVQENLSRAYPNAGYEGGNFAGVLTGTANAYGVRFGSRIEGSSGQIYYDPFLIMDRAITASGGLDNPQEVIAKYMGLHAGVAVHELSHQLVHSEGESLARELTFKMGDGLLNAPMIQELFNRFRVNADDVINTIQKYDKYIKDARNSETGDEFLSGLQTESTGRQAFSAKPEDTSGSSEVRYQRGQAEIKDTSDPLNPNTRYQRPIVDQAKGMFQEATNRANKFAEVDNLESRGGIHAVVAKGMRAFYATRSFMEGKPQAFEKAIYALSPERQVMLGEHIGQELDQRRFIKPSNEIAEAYGEYRQQWQKFWPSENNKAGHTVRAAGGQRERLTDPYYGPFHMWSDNVRDIMTNKQGSPEYVKLQDDYIKQHVQAHQQNGIPLQEAQTRASAEFSEEIRALSVPYDPTAAGTFAGARKAQGIPLPHSWREYNIAKLIKSYDRRSAIDFAMQEHMERSPEIMAALGSKTFFNDQPIPAQIKAAIPDISTDKSVQSILREMSGQPATKPDSVGAGASRGISALTIGTVSKATEVPTTMIAGLRYLQMSDYLPGTMKFIEKLADWSALQERSYASGLNKRDASQNMRQVSGVAENAAGFLNKFAEGVSSVTGLNQLESAARTIAQGWGEVLVQINKNKAATGDKDAVRMLDSLSPDWRTRSDADLAAQFGKLMQGSYDMTQLPAWMLESGAAPYLTWSKWSAGQYSNFVKFAIEPAMQGNVKPLIGHLLIGAMGGAAVDQIREWMNNREGRDVNWSELESWMQQNQGQLGAEGMKQLSVKLLNIVQGVGTFGIAGDIAKMVTTAAVGGTAQGIATAPVANAVFDTSKKVAAALKAIDDGEDFGLVLRQAMGDIAQTHIQVARVGRNWLDEQENLRYDDRRQRRLFDELTGAPTQAGTFSVNYGNLAERAFERGSVSEKTGEEAFNLVSRARQEATSGEDYASRIRKLKTSQNAIMPSLERQPMKAARYLGFVEGAEPGKGSETLKRYYTRQNEDKYRKSLIEGMSGIR